MTSGTTQIGGSVADTVLPAANRAVLDALPVLVWSADADGNCRFVNQAWRDYTGRSIDQAQGDGWIDSVHPNDRRGVWDASRRMLEARQPFQAAFRVMRADGTHGWVHCSALPLTGAGGRFEGFLGCAQDITDQRNAEFAARNREAQIRLLADNVPALIAYYESVSLKCRFANRAYAAHYGWDVESIVGKTVPEVIGADAYALIKPHVDRCIAGETVNYERGLTLPSGEQRVIEVSLIPQKDSSGTPVAAFVLINDITKHHLTERAIRETGERLRKFAEVTSEGIVFHEKGVCMDCNEAVLRLIGCEYHELIGKSVLDFLAPSCREQVRYNIEQGIERVYEGAVLHKDGHEIPVEFAARVVTRDGVTQRITVVRDITERKHAEARIQFLAHHDVLTGLPNRMQLKERLDFLLSVASRRGSEMAVLFIDLDNFKTVNDSLGHHVGDELLKHVAERIQSALRGADVVSRLGGDEFVVVLPDLAGAEDAARVAAKLIEVIARPLPFESRELVVTPSVGIALYPQDGGTPDTLIRNADAAMYLAKERGRSNFQFYTSSLHDAAFDALVLESELREAIKNREFVLHYQPQIDIATGALVGVEALVRWKHPERGIVGPNHFIPVAEQRGLISTIGAWVLEEACRQNKAWQQAGLASVPMAVNLSAVQFKQPDLPQQVASVLHQTGIDGDDLEIEITESVLTDDAAAMAAMLERLQKLGVRIAIDDFGTGYSSLSHLKRYPIDKLKIDRSFLRDVPNDSDNCAISSAIISLSRSLGITVLAEGVENDAQIDFLRKHGCDEMQGYYVSRALPANEATVVLRRLQSEKPPTPLRPR